MTENGKDVTTLKARVDDLTEQVSVKDTTIQEKNAKIADFEKTDIEAIQTEQFNLGKAESSKEIEDFKKQNALEKALSQHKAKDSKIVSSLLDIEKITYGEDGKVEGLEEQIKVLQTSHDYLFETDEKAPQFAGKTSGAEAGVSDVELRSAMGLPL